MVARKAKGPPSAEELQDADEWHKKFQLAELDVALGRATPEDMLALAREAKDDHYGTIESLRTELESLSEDAAEDAKSVEILDRNLDEFGDSVRGGVADLETLLDTLEQATGENPPDDLPGPEELLRLAKDEVASAVAVLRKAADRRCPQALFNRDSLADRLGDLESAEAAAKAEEAKARKLAAEAERQRLGPAGFKAVAKAPAKPRKPRGGNK